MRHMLYFILLALFACQKDPNPAPPSPTSNPSRLKILWQVPVMPDTSGFNTTAHALVDGGIVFSVNFSNLGNFVQMREADSGALRWKFLDFINPPDGFLVNKILNVGNKVAINDWDITYCVDAKSGKRDWAIDIGDEGGGGDPFINVIGDYVYKANYTGVSPAHSSASVVRAHYLTGKWDTLLTIKPDTGCYVFISPPTLWINPQGDSVLILREAGIVQHSFPLHNGQTNFVNLYAWNMRTKQFEWQKKDFQGQFSIQGGQLIIDDNLTYVNSQHNVYCINLLDGSVLWKRTFPGFVNASNMVYHRNLVMVHDSDHGIWGISKVSGETVWYNERPIGTVDDMKYYDGVVYYVSSGSPLLYAIDAETGATIWAEYSRTNKSGATFGWSAVVIDPDREVLYASDRYYLYCIALPKH